MRSAYASKSIRSFHGPILSLLCIDMSGEWFWIAIWTSWCLLVLGVLIWGVSANLSQRMQMFELWFGYLIKVLLRGTEVNS